MAAEVVTNNNKDFDIYVVAKNAEKCLGEKAVVIMDNYITTYRELNKFFNVLGALFKFVISDVNSKLKILQEFRDGENGLEYITVQSMVAFELGKGDIQNQPDSGSRTLLRLHRAMAFVARLFKDLTEMSENDRISSVTWNAYNDTLAQFHPWLVRQGVGLGVYAVPDRQQLLDKIKCTSDTDLLICMKGLSEKLQQIYGVVQEVYKENDILDLP